MLSTNNVVDFETERYIRTSSIYTLWDRLINHCLLTIESCMGEILPDIAKEESMILKELKRRNTRDSLQAISSYNTAKLIAVIELEDAS